MDTKSLLSEHGFDGIITRLGIESITSVLVADEEVGVVKPIIGADGSVAANLIDIALNESSGVSIGARGEFDGGIVGLYHGKDRKSTRLNSSHANISDSVLCLQKNHTQNSV